ncbi:MAG: ABC transporter permease [Actinobacteria bacterium]|nr:ABC transporter permease [Actinomycetota bacterium]
MLRVALKSVLGNKLRLALTALAVVLGVAFVAGTFVLTDSIDRAFGNLLDEVNEEVDVYVNPASTIERDVTQPAVGEAGPTLDEALLQDVLEVDGVAGAAGFVQGFAQIIDQEGEPVGGMGPPTFGMSFVESDRTITIREGRPPTAPGEVTIDAATAELTDYEVGDTVPVLLAGGVEEFELVAITGFGDADNLLGATIATFEMQTAQTLLGKEGRFDQIAVRAEEGVDAETLAARIGDAVAGPSVEVVTADAQVAEDRQQITEGLSFINVALLAFAGIALFVGAFLIVNTFSIIVAQRTREFALLRAVGASASQVRTAVILEAVAIGVLAGVVGVLAGIGLAQALRAIFGAIGIDFPDGGLVLLPRTVIVSFVIAVLITAVAAVVPAQRASRITPVEAMRESAGDERERIGRGRTLAGTALGVAGGILVAVGLVLGPGNAIAFVGAGAAAMFVGVSLLAPYVAGPAAAVIGALAGRTVSGRLGRGNAARNPRRTASTASALMIGVALVTFVSIFAASATASVSRLFNEQLGADLTVQSASGFTPIPPGFAAALRELDAVGAVTPVRSATIRIDGVEGRSNIGAADPVAMPSLIEIGVVEGELADLTTPDTVLLHEDFAAAEDLVVGDDLDVAFTTGATTTVEVVGIYANEELAAGPLLVSLETLERHVEGAFDLIVVADAAEGVEVEDARVAIGAVANDFPGVVVRDQAQLREQSQEQVDQLLNIMIGLLMLALIIALIGIVNTLALSVFERTREIGLLRAVGMERRQVRRMVRWEAVIVAVFGAVLGVTVGAFFGWAVVTSLADEGLPVLEFPVGRLLVYVIVAALAGVLAAVFPARRAARLDVLEAVTTE